MKNLLDRFWSEFRGAIRSVRLSFGVIAVAILMLAGAAGASAALSGLVSRGLLAPPALVPAPERVFTLAFKWEDDQGRRSAMTTTSLPSVTTIGKGIAVRGRAAAFQKTSSAMLLSGTQREVAAALVSSDYVEVLGVPPLLGRRLDSTDDRAGSPAIVLGHASGTLSAWLSASTMTRASRRSGMEPPRPWAGRYFSSRSVEAPMSLRLIARSRSA